MKEWKHKIDLTDVWGTEDPEQISKEVCRQLGNIPLKGMDDDQREERDRLYDEFEMMDSDTEISEFDEVFDDFYRWADEDKLVWIEVPLC